MEPSSSVVAALNTTVSAALANSIATATGDAAATRVVDSVAPIQLPPFNLSCYFRPSASLASEGQLQFSRYVNGYLTGVCVIVGTIGNVMSVRSVRISNFERNRGIGLAVAIFVLAIWDTLMLWCAIAYYGLKSLIPTTGNDWAILVTPFFHGFSQVTHTASVWSVVTITVQRYMATRDPFRNTRQNRAMFCSFRTSAPPPTPAASASATNSAVCKTPLAGCVSVRADASKWHRGLFGNGSRKSAIERNTPRTAHNYTYQRHYAASILQQRKKLVVTSSDTTTKNTINPTATITTITTKTNTPKSIANSTPTTAKFNVAANCLYASKCKPSCWTYLVRYKRHFRMPFIISVLAILVNLPAFFEIMVLPCYSFPDYRLIYKLQVSHFRLNDYYKFWYRMVFRMLVTTCGPNIFILCLTVLTVVMLRGTNRSRQRLFHNNELAIEQYSSRAKMLTTISICLAVKFLFLRSLTFMLDIWEVAFGFKRDVHRYLYAVDVSNFLIIFNSSTNCLIIYGFSRWLHHKISARNLEKRERQQCLNSINTKRRTMLMHDSWMKTIKLTHRQFGNRILYAMLLKNPQMFAPFRSDGAAAAHDDETSAGGGARYVTTCSAAVENAVAAATAPADEDVHNFGISNSNCAAPHTEALMEAAEEHDSKAAERAKLLPSITLTTYLTDDEHNGNDRISQADEKEARDEFEPRNENRASSLRVSSDSETHKSPIVGASRCTLDVEAAAAATLSVIPKKKKRSIDLLLNAKFYAFGEQIFQFFDQLIQLMQQGSNEQAIIAKIQYVGKVHYNHGITFTSSAWKEFKTTALSIFADCEYASDEDRTEALEAWSAFLSIIIHNMKLGMWNDNNCYSVYNNNTNNANSFSNNNSHYSASYCNSYGYDQRNNKGTPR